MGSILAIMALSAPGLVDPLAGMLDLLSGSGVGIFEDARMLSPEYGRGLVEGLERHGRSARLDADPKPLLQLFEHLGCRLNAARDPLEPRLDPNLPEVHVDNGDLPEVHVDNGDLFVAFKATPQGFVYRRPIPQSADTITLHGDDVYLNVLANLYADPPDQGTLVDVTGLLDLPAGSMRNIGEESMAPAKARTRPGIREAHVGDLVVLSGYRRAGLQAVLEGFRDTPLKASVHARPNRRGPRAVAGMPIYSPKQPYMGSALPWGCTPAEYRRRGEAERPKARQSFARDNASSMVCTLQSGAAQPGA